MDPKCNPLCPYQREAEGNTHTPKRRRGDQRQRLERVGAKTQAAGSL